MNGVLVIMGAGAVGENTTPNSGKGRERGYTGGKNLFVSKIFHGSFLEKLAKIACVGCKLRLSGEEVLRESGAYKKKKLPGGTAKKIRKQRCVVWLHCYLAGHSYLLRTQEGTTHSSLRNTSVFDSKSACFDGWPAEGKAMIKTV